MCGGVQTGHSLCQGRVIKHILGAVQGQVLRCVVRVLIVPVTDHLGGELQTGVGLGIFIGAEGGVQECLVVPEARSTGIILIDSHIYRGARLVTKGGIVAGGGLPGPGTIRTFRITIPQVAEHQVAAQGRHIGDLAVSGLSVEDTATAVLYLFTLHNHREAGVAVAVFQQHGGAGTGDLKVYITDALVAVSGGLAAVHIILGAVQHIGVAVGGLRGAKVALAHLGLGVFLHGSHTGHQCVRGCFQPGSRHIGPAVTGSVQQTVGLHISSVSSRSVGVQLTALKQCLKGSHLRSQLRLGTLGRSGRELQVAVIADHTQCGSFIGRVGIAETHIECSAVGHFPGVDYARNRGGQLAVHIQNRFFAVIRNGVIGLLAGRYGHLLGSGLICTAGINGKRAVAANADKVFVRSSQCKHGAGSTQVVIVRLAGMTKGHGKAVCFHQRLNHRVIHKHLALIEP